MGIRFSKPISTPSLQPVSRCNKSCGTHAQVLILVHTLYCIGAPHHAVRAQIEMQGVMQVDEAKQGLQQVVTVVTPSRDMQEQIQFGGRWAA